MGGMKATCSEYLIPKSDGCLRHPTIVHIYGDPAEGAILQLHRAADDSRVEGIHIGHGAITVKQTFHDRCI